MKYSIEQIEAAIAAVRNGKLCIPEKIITELIRPVWKPEVGEVYSYPDFSGNEHYLKHGFADVFKGNERPLTPDEVPAWKRDKAALKVAIEALESIAWSEGDEISKAETAIGKIKELTNETIS